MERRNFAALAYVAAVTALYSVTENNWFNSHVRQVVGATHFDGVPP